MVRTIRPAGCINLRDELYEIQLNHGRRTRAEDLGPPLRQASHSKRFLPREVVNKGRYREGAVYGRAHRFRPASVSGSVTREEHCRTGSGGSVLTPGAGAGWGVSDDTESVLAWLHDASRQRRSRCSLTRVVPNWKEDWPDWQGRRFPPRLQRCGGPPGSNIVTSAWVEGMCYRIMAPRTVMRLTPAETQDAGLLLNKNGPTSDCSAAGAPIYGFELRWNRYGTRIRSYRFGGHCGAGASRFSIKLMAGSTYLAGCARGAQTAAPQRSERALTVPSAISMSLLWLLGRERSRG